MHMGSPYTRIWGLEKTALCQIPIGGTVVIYSTKDLSFFTYKANQKTSFLANFRSPGYMNFQKTTQTSFLANFRRPGYMNFQKKLKHHFWPIFVDPGT